MGGFEPSGGGKITANAEAAFASFLARVCEGEEVDFDRFVEGRPELADSLRALHDAWQAGGGDSRGAAKSGRVQTIREFLEDKSGLQLEPRPQDADAGSGIEERLRQISTRSGRYHLRDEVARGGMGVILEVWDRDFRRPLAMKAAFGPAVVRDERGEHAADPLLVSRFLEEAQITGQLDHPGIVPVHEIGVDDEGRLFFTMRLVKGQTLDEVIRLAREDKDDWNRPRAVNVLLRVCEAMAFAHAKGVIHRDIKPANIMVGKFGETYVMDWGLAKVIGRLDLHDLRVPGGVSVMRSQVRTDRGEDLQRAPGSPLMTMDGTIVGTPTYMPPEQAEGRIDQLDPRSDVYSVGALLYTLLTGCMPYVGPEEHLSPMDVLSRLLQGPPTPAEDLDPSVPPELASICSKAMARDPGDRYATMVEMAADLRAYVERRVVRAYETGAIAEFRKWVHRNRAFALATAALLVLLVGGAVLVAWQQRARVREVSAARGVAERQRVRAETNARAAVASEQRARENADRAERQGYLAGLAAAHASLRTNETREARAMLRACPERFRGWEWRHLMYMTDTSRQVLRGHEGQVTGVSLSADGKRLATVSADRTLRLWDAEAGHAGLSLAGATDELTGVALRPDGSQAATVCKDSIVRVWDAQSGRLLAPLAGHESVTTSVAYSADGRRLVSGSSDETARVWDAESFRPLATLRHGLPVHAVAISADGSRVAAAGDDGIRLWPAAGGEPELEIETNEPVRSLALGSAALAAGLFDGTVALFDPESGERLLVLRGHTDPVSAVAFAGPGRLVSASHDRTLRVWDLESGACDAVLRGHDDAVTGVAVAGDVVASVSADRTARLWSLATGAGTITLRGDEDYLSSVAFGPKGKTLAATSAGHGEIRIWDVASGRELRYVPEDNGALTSVAYSPDGRWLLAGGEEDATGRLHDAADGRLVRRFEGHEASVTAVAFSPDGRLAATASADRTARLWEVSTGKPVRVLEGHARALTSVAFDPAGSLLLTASLDGTARLWEVGNGRELRVLDVPGGAVLAAVFDPAGKRVATAGADHRIRCWDAASGKAGLVLAGHAEAVSALAFSPDGARLLSGGHDKTVRLWDAATGDALLRLRVHTEWVTSVAFSPDGDRIASGSFDSTARIFTALPAAR